MTIGTFGGGAPRFTLFDGSLNSAYIYWGTPEGGGSFSDPNAGSTSLNGTGNYADLASSDIRVYSNGFDGDNTSNTGETWSQFVSQVGSTDLSYITLDLDGGSFGPEQQMLVRDFTVNTQVYNPSSTAVPEPVSLALFGSALAGFGLLRRRNRRT